jgi:hypothetical protein
VAFELETDGTEAAPEIQVVELDEETDELPTPKPPTPKFANDWIRIHSIDDIYPIESNID